MTSPRSVDYDVARYELRGEFDWARNRLAATVQIRFSLTSDAARSITLDSDSLEVKAVRLAGGGALGHTLPEEGRLDIDLSSVPGLARGEEIAIEIDYEAAAEGALRAVPERMGDPVAVRTVYTMSEPLGVAEWMPCHNTPDDRAVFAVDMRVGEGETMIANGALVEEGAGDGAPGRRVRYETGYTIPTYLMAFAIGDFEVTTAKKGDLPLSVWRRRGLAGDHDKVLEELARSIGRFEELLVPYPFEKYALVLLPDFPVGGVENASISFQRELGSAQPALASDLILSAHELAHQWFGDLVTVKSWDDLWIKEGMATLLEYESARIYTDESGAGTLNGGGLWAEEGEAIRDTSLAPDEKYTSGPYGRAAWLLTQIRSLVGEEEFWKALRGVLEEHRFGAVGTDEFLGAFAPALGPEGLARARRAVDAKAIPRLELAEAPSGGVLATLSDPDGALIAPMEMKWTAEDGTTRSEALEVGGAVEIAPRQAGELLVLDPRDRHPDWTAFIAEDADHALYEERISPLRAPASAAGLEHFLEAGGAHQVVALELGLPEMAPDWEIPSFCSRFHREIEHEGEKTGRFSRNFASRLPAFM